MPAPIGNEYYKIRSKDGRGKIYETPEQLVEQANEYFQFCLDTPHKEEIAYHFQGSVITGDLNKMRAFSIEGLCNYLDITRKTFLNYKENKDLLQVITRIQEIIDMQQFEGAVSGFLNANLIARKLGLTEKTETNLKGKIDIEQITGMVIK
jgi:hypothetical protein